MNQIFTINSRKFDGKIHRSWKADLIEQKDALLTFVGVFDQEVNHPILGVIRRETVSYEFYWLDRWYNIFRFHEPGGELRNFYCNISQPPVLTEDILDYIDFDIDLLVWKDFSYQILDLEEFEENEKIFKYPPKVVENIHAGIAEIEFMIEQRLFPFDFKEF
jgi:uncharacterized protein